MKKKYVIIAILLIGLFCFTGCGKSKIDLNNYLIEQRTTLFTGSDKLYTVSYSGGMREENYSLDGKVNKLIPFGVITLTRTDGEPLAKDNYTYTVKINDQEYTGSLQEANSTSYCADLQINAPTDATIDVTINFTGYIFNSQLANTSNKFKTNLNGAIKIANSELQENLTQMLKDKSNQIEVVTKIIKDYTNSEVESYYWYVGIVSTNGQTLGLLIDANTGSVIAKKI